MGKYVSWTLLVLVGMMLACKKAVPEKVPSCEELAQHWADATLNAFDDPRERHLHEKDALESIRQGQLAECPDWSDAAKACFGKAKSDEQFHGCSSKAGLEMARKSSKATAANVDEAEENFPDILNAVVAYHEKHPSVEALDLWTAVEKHCCAGCTPSDDAYGAWDVIGYRPEGKHFLHYSLYGKRKGSAGAYIYSINAMGDVDCDGETSSLSMTFCIEGGALSDCLRVEPDMFEFLAYRQIRVGENAGE